jgi:diguanylate cyclase (GGDEF)-like protein
MLASLVVSTAIGLLLYRISNRLTDSLRRNVGDLRHMATHDSLTGLPNRNAITQLIDQQVRASARFALLYMDLDGFKQVNDAHGHAFGDRLLKLAASRIRGRLRGVDTVARIGGDEFVAVLHGVTEPGECEHAARHIIEAFAEPFFDQDVHANIGISVGVALAPASGREAGQILSAADRAMYRAKSRGSNRYELYPAPAGLVLAEQAAG